MQSSVTRCYLLALPAEVRNEIYELVVVVSDPVQEHHFAVIPLARTCRQIREETVKMFFQQNIFRFDCHLFVPQLLQTIRDPIEEMRFIEIHTAWNLTSHPHTPDSLILCLDVKEGLRNLKTDVLCDNETRQRYDLGSCESFPWRSYDVEDARCRACRRIGSAIQYLHDCGRVAGTGTYVTKDIFRQVARILIGKP